MKYLDIENFLCGIERIILRIYGLFIEAWKKLFYKCDSMNS